MVPWRPDIGPPQTAAKSQNNFQKLGLSLLSFLKYHKGLDYYVYKMGLQVESFFNEKTGANYRREQQSSRELIEYLRDCAMQLILCVHLT